MKKRRRSRRTQWVLIQNTKCNFLVLQFLFMTDFLKIIIDFIWLKSPTPTTEPLDSGPTVDFGRRVGAEV